MLDLNNRGTVISVLAKSLVLEVVGGLFYYNYPMTTFTYRLAVLDDIPALEELIGISARALQSDYYSSQQIEGALGSVLAVDSQLIKDGTYFAVGIDSQIVACGGWSKRKTLFGGDSRKSSGADDFLDPRTESARIRAFFVHPQWARQGIGTHIIELCEKAALDHGFSTMELVATLSGIPLYERAGYRKTKKYLESLSNGESYEAWGMERKIGSRQ